MTSIKWVGVLFIVGMLASSAKPDAETAAPTEYQVKAAYLVGFARFVAWPPETKADPFVIGVLGDDPFGPYLDFAVKGKSLNGKRMVVQRLGRGDKLTRCHVLFIASSEATRMSQIGSDLKGHPVLTVSDFKGFVDQGGMIGLILKDTQVRFQVNLQSVTASRMTISSRLLALAVSVKR